MCVDVRDTAVNLSNCDVSSLKGISSCPQLQHVIVRSHRLHELPDELTVLAGSLETLDVSNGPLRHLPAFVCEFRALRQLNVSNTMIRRLPDEIGQLVHLRSLDVGRCPVESLPESIRKLRVCRI